MRTLHEYLFLLVLISCNFPDFVISLTNLTSDQSALLVLISHFNLSPSHTLSMNWSNSTSTCTWIGVTCGSRHVRVTGLDLSSMDINGTMPPQVGNLSFLFSLNFSRNNFYGSMPESLTNLRRLRVLDFSYNNLNGNIRSWFSSLPRLQISSLRSNSFTGVIPPLTNMSNIEALDLSYNALEGSIPDQMGELHNLQELLLNSNQLSGSIPSALFNISTMEILNLERNRLSGSLPDTMCSGPSNLLRINVTGNSLSGAIPANLPNCSILRSIWFGENQFSGSVPRGFANLRNLRILYLQENNLRGRIFDDLSNITTLRVLDVSRNYFTGTISLNSSLLRIFKCERNNLSGTLPLDMCSRLKQLYGASFADNNLHGPFPTRLYECSVLRYLLLSGNRFTGVLPREIGNSTRLEILYLRDNMFTGTIPHEIGNLASLEEFSLAGNNFTGSIPETLLNITTLRRLLLSRNQLVGDLPEDLGLRLPNLVALHLFVNNFTSASQELNFITSLTNCKNLAYLAIASNPLRGVLPPSIGNLSTSLQYLHLYDCGLRGSIPAQIGNLSNLIVLSLYGNNFTGSLPTSLANMQNLQGLYLYSNRISGTIPSSICQLSRLNALYLNDNGIHGPIPQCIGNITTLNALDLSMNNLDSTIPVSLWHITDLLQVNLSSNRLTGSLPSEMGNLTSLTAIDFSLNELSGIIPVSIGGLQELANLSLAYNRLHGSLPDSLAQIVNLEVLDLSHNNFSGTIPVSMEDLVHLSFFNVSFNGLSGEIPSGGPFENFTSQSFMANSGLCGELRYNVTPCRENRVTRARNRWGLRVIFIVLGASVFVIAVLVMAYWFSRGRMKDKVGSNAFTIPGQVRISYYELLEATNRYSENNLIGSGSFGSVYRGTLSNGKVVAVKVFHQQMEGAFESFEVECEVLRNLRHRNLCKVIGCCSNEDFKALILDYMSSGSLEKNLYSKTCSLDIVRRINIMIDVASALEYLHYEHPTPIIHCDLKPSNILLDEDMEGHLTDFGLAKVLGDGETVTQTLTLATLGYIAPEFGTDGHLSIRSDIYSYGITLMEVFTGRKPNDEAFTGDSRLRRWVEDSMTHGIVHIIDPNIVQAEEDEEHFTLKLNCFRSIMELALQCSMESARDRISIRDVQHSLKKIRNRLLQ